jgi:hypothetical protein
MLWLINVRRPRPLPPLYVVLPLLVSNKGRDGSTHRTLLDINERRGCN